MTRHKGKIWYQLASEQDREIYICTDENSNSQSQSKKKKKMKIFPLSITFSSVQVVCVLLVRIPCTTLKSADPRNTPGQEALGASGTALSGSDILI